MLVHAFVRVARSRVNPSNVVAREPVFVLGSPVRPSTDRVEIDRLRPVVADPRPPGGVDVLAADGARAVRVEEDLGAVRAQVRPPVLGGRVQPRDELRRTEAEGCRLTDVEVASGGPLSAAKPPARLLEK